MKARIISFINMKGGVGKTTLTIGISDFLAKNGDKVLVVDADPQFNATQALLTTYKKNKYSEDDENNFYIKEVLSIGKTIFKLFKPQTSMLEVYDSPKAEDMIINLTSNLDILCGDLNLVLANKMNDHSFVKRIKNFIDDNDLREKYDYIMIDCPPTLTIYTDSALMASDYYLIPNRIDRYSIVGIDSLQRAVKTLIREERIKLKCIGLVYTMVDTKNSKKEENIRISLESKKAVEDIYIFTATSKEVKDIQRGKSGPIPTNYKSAKEDIEAICMELKIQLDINER